MMQIIFFLSLFVWASYSGESRCIRPFGSAIIIDEVENKIAGIQTGILQLKPSPKLVTYATVAYRQEHDVKNINVIVTFAFIKNYNNPNGIDLEIQSVPDDSSFNVTFKYSQTSKFSFASLYYLISSRPEVRLGSFVCNSPILKQTSKKHQQIIFDYPMKNLDVPVKTRIKTYLSLGALRSKNSNFNLELYNAIYSTRDEMLHIELDLFDNKQPIQFLKLSYLIFSFNGVVFGQEYLEPGSFVYKTMNDQHFDISGWVGVSAFLGIKPDSNSSSKNKNRLLTEGGNLLRMFPQYYDLVKIKRTGSYKKVKQDIPQIKQLQVSKGQIYEFQRSFQMIQLDLNIKIYLQPLIRSKNLLKQNETLKKIVDDNKCLSYELCTKLKGNILKIDNVDACVICDQTQTWNEILSKCQCLPGSIQKEEVCVPISKQCSHDQIYFQGHCMKINEKLCLLENQVFNVELGHCVCTDGFKQLINLRKKLLCVKECPADTIFSHQQNKCTCQQGSTAKVCTECEQSEILELMSQKCLCKDRQNRKQNGRCKQCQAGKKINIQTGSCEII